MRILLATPPLTQLNTPYPATCYLTGFLKKRGFSVFQADPGLELVLRVFSKAGLEEVATLLKKSRAEGNTSNKASKSFFENETATLSRVEPAVRFLQGKDPTLAYQIIGRRFFPEGPRFSVLREFEALADPHAGQVDALGWAFGTLGLLDRAKFLATLFLDDIADVIKLLDPKFEFSRYGEKLAASAPTIEPLLAALNAPTFLDQHLKTITRELIQKHQPDLLCLTTPFPGNVFGAFWMAKCAKEFDPKIKVLLGGGYVNTELRELSEPRLFEFFDAVTLDDGEGPLLRLIDYFSGAGDETTLQRTFLCRGGRVEFFTSPEKDIAQAELGFPTYEGLKLDQYLSLFEMLNPMHRIWSDGRWNKLTLAHGCYWKKCNFCDVTLDYIQRYEPSPVETTLNRMKHLIEETGSSGFHFVDEAAPPALLRSLSERMVADGLSATWWGNVRFEKSFDDKLTQLMSQAGCIAISGGLEVASDRLLKLMQKGISVEQVARVTHSFSQAGIMVHAYLMYGFPTQTEQETIDSLERVRQLFESGCIQSAFWHRFSATAHSPVGQNPELFQIKISKRNSSAFAKNDLDFTDPTPCDHEWLGVGLKKAVYNYMLGIGLDQDVRSWFPPRGKAKTPKAQVPPDLIARALQSGKSRQKK